MLRYLKLATPLAHAIVLPSCDQAFICDCIPVTQAPPYFVLVRTIQFIGVTRFGSVHADSATLCIGTMIGATLEMVVREAMPPDGTLCEDAEQRMLPRFY